MRIGKASIAAVLCLLLCGCSAKHSAMQQALNFRSALLAAQSCTFDADVQVHYGEELFSFGLSCAYDTDGSAELTVTSPQTISGIRAKIGKDGTQLQYEDTAIALAPLANGNLAPMELPRLLGECWAGEYIRAAGTDGEGFRVTYLSGYDEEELAVDVWFSLDECEPEYCEVTYQGEMLISANITDFSTN